MFVLTDVPLSYGTKVDCRARVFMRKFPELTKSVPELPLRRAGNAAGGGVENPALYGSGLGIGHIKVQPILKWTGVHEY